MTLAAGGPGEVTADLIEADTGITILNKDHIIATLTDEITFEMEFTVAKGRGYVPASEMYEDRTSRRSASSPSTRSTQPRAARPVQGREHPRRVRRPTTTS